MNKPEKSEGAMLDPIQRATFEARWQRFTFVAWVASLALLLYSFSHPEGDGVLASGSDRDTQYSTSTSTPSSSNLETAVVPAGTRIQIRMEHALTPQRTLSGEHVSAFLYGPIWVDGKFLAPSRSKILVQLTRLDSEAADGRAQWAITVQELILNGQHYRLEVEPLTLDASADGNKHGAMQNGNQGSVGAANGVPTSNPLSAYDPESQFAFVLSAPLELPVIKKARRNRMEQNPVRSNSSPGREETLF